MRENGFLLGKQCYFTPGTDAIYKTNNRRCSLCMVAKEFLKSQVVIRVLEKGKNMWGAFHSLSYHLPTISIFLPPGSPHSFYFSFPPHLPTHTPTQLPTFLLSVLPASAVFIIYLLHSYPVFPSVGTKRSFHRNLSFILTTL